MRLLIEIVITNWRDDCYLKMSDYGALGVPEYWIVDYAALGGRKFIGNPKQPTVSLFSLIEGEYSSQHFRGQDQIISPQLPDLVLTADQIFNSSLSQE